MLFSDQDHIHFFIRRFIILIIIIMDIHFIGKFLRERCSKTGSVSKSGRKKVSNVRFTLDTFAFPYRFGTTAMVHREIQTKLSSSSLIRTSQTWVVRP